MLGSLILVLRLQSGIPRKRPKAQVEVSQVAAAVVVSLYKRSAVHQLLVSLILGL